MTQHLHARDSICRSMRAAWPTFRHAAIFGALDSLQPGGPCLRQRPRPLPLLERRSRSGTAIASASSTGSEPGAIVIDFSVR